MIRVDLPPERISAEGAAVAFSPPAATAAHSSPASLRVDWIRGADLSHIAKAWSDLSSRAVETNAYFEPEFVLPAIERLNNLAGFAVLAVWDISASADRLVGILPVEMQRFRWGLPVRVVVGLSHNYGPLGTPLLDREQAHTVAGALLDSLSRGPLRADYLLLSYLNLSGEAVGALRAAMAERGLTALPFNPHQRAMKFRSTADEGHKKFKELARQHRRLEEKGTVAFEVVTDSMRIETDVEAFLTLEAAGWKGRAGTATLQRPDRTAFFRQVVRGMAAVGKAQTHSLRVDGKPIAIGITFTSQNRAWFWKIAYDEAYSKYSPGVQLAMHVTNYFRHRPDILVIDSTADANHPMIDRLWLGRADMADWLISLNPQAVAGRAIVGRLEGLRREGRSRLVRIVKRLLGRG